MKNKEHATHLFTDGAGGIKEYLNQKEYGEIISIFDVVESTNDLAKAYALTKKESGYLNKIFIADSQTAGRGRRGRYFYSPPNTGLYISFLIHPREHNKPENIVGLTTAASVAVSEAIDNVTSAKTEIKWVNDVYCKDKKICGILTECVTDFDGCAAAAIIGIGINLTTEVFPTSAGELAGSLAYEHKICTRNRLAAELINKIDEIVCHQVLKNSDCSYIREYKKRLMVLDKDIVIQNSGETAHVLDVDDCGGLVVDVCGERRILNTGEISIRQINR